MNALTAAQVRLLAKGDSVNDPQGACTLNVGFEDDCEIDAPQNREQLCSK